MKENKCQLRTSHLPKGSYKSKHLDKLEFFAEITLMNENEPPKEVGIMQ